MKLQKKQPNKTDLSLEISLFQKGYRRIVGIDEAGRGCWAGPVAIGAYILYPESKIVEDITDSKKLSPNKRSLLLDQLPKDSYILKLQPAALIDTIGIAGAITDAIKDIVTELSTPDTFFLIDGQFREEFTVNCRKIIKGDSKHYSIAAASIVAKVKRDLHLIDLDREYPGYEFAKHKGYGTSVHAKALSVLGPCNEHRKTFAPVAGMLVAK